MRWVAPACPRPIRPHPATCAPNDPVFRRLWAMGSGGRATERQNIVSSASNTPSAKRQTPGHGAVPRRSAWLLVYCRGPGAGHRVAEPNAQSSQLYPRQLTCCVWHTQLSKESRGECGGNEREECVQEWGAGAARCPPTLAAIDSFCPGEFLQGGWPKCPRRYSRRRPDGACMHVLHRLKACRPQNCRLPQRLWFAAKAAGAQAGGWYGGDASRGTPPS